MKKLSKYAILAYIVLFALCPSMVSASAREDARSRSSIPSSEDSIRYPFKIEALCSLYSKYEVCHPVITPTKISSYFPTEFISLTADEIISIDVYDSRRREMNYLLGTASTIIFGPYGLIGFLTTKKVGDVDFGIRYKDGQRIRTAFIRFKNNQSLSRFGMAIEPLLKSISGRSKMDAHE